MDKKWWYLLGFLGIIAFTESDKNVNMSGIKQRRSKRLYFISNDRAIPHDQVDTAKRMAKSGYGKIHAVWAYSADEARALIRQGKAETLGGLQGIGDIRVSINKVPSYGTYKRLMTEIKPELQSNKQLINNLARIRAIEFAFFQNILPSDYYNPTAYGPIPVDPYIAVNPKFWIEEYLTEIKKRKLDKADSYTIWLDLHHLLPKRAEHEIEPTWKPKAKMIPEKQGQMTLFGRLRGLGAFDLQTAPLWEITPSMYLAKMNIHEPWIAEIAPTQYVRLSNRVKSEYDKKRSAEWDASAKGKAEWANKVWEAYKKGEFSPDDPGVSKEAKNHIFFAESELEKLDKRSLQDKIRESNTIKNFNQLNVGDRVWSVMTRDYYAVVKVNPKSVRLQSEALYKPFGKGEPVPLIRTTKYHNELRRLSPDEEEKEFEKTYIPYKYIQPIKQMTAKKKTIPEQTTMFKIPSQMTLFGGAR